LSDSCVFVLIASSTLGPLFLPAFLSKRPLFMISNGITIYVLLVSVFAIITAFDVIAKKLKKYPRGPSLAGIMMPVMCLLLEKGGWRLSMLTWRMFHGQAWPFIPAVLGGLLISAVESIRLINLVQAVHDYRLRDPRECVATVLVSIATGLVLEVAHRLRFIPSLWHALYRGQHCAVSPEDDLLLRVRFEFDYVAHACLLLLPAFSLICKASHSHVGFGCMVIFSVVTANFFGVLLTDGIVLICQHFIRSETGQLNLTFEDLRHTLTQLRKPGGHAVPRLWIQGSKRPIAPASYGALADEEPKTIFYATAHQHVGLLMLFMVLELTRGPFMSVVCVWR